MRFRSEATERRSNSSRYCGVNNKGFCYQLGRLFYRVTLFLFSTLCAEVSKSPGTVSHATARERTPFA